MASRDKFRYYVPGRSTNNSSGAPGRLDKVRLNHLLASDGDSSGSEANDGGSATSATSVNYRSDNAQARSQIPVQDYYAQTGSYPSEPSGANIQQGYPSVGGNSRVHSGRSATAISNRHSEIGTPFDHDLFHEGPYLGQSSGDAHLHDATLLYRQNSPSDPRYTSHGHFGAGSAEPPASSEFNSMTGIQVPSGRGYEPVMLVIFLGAPPYNIHHVRKLPYGEVASLSIEQLLAFVTSGGTQ